jgi:signal transduction histidine kinase
MAGPLPTIFEMQGLQHAIPRRCASGRWFGPGLWFPGLASAAAEAPAPAGIGPWVFASVALLLVAALGYALGRSRERGRSSARGAAGADGTAAGRPRHGAATTAALDAKQDEAAPSVATAQSSLALVLQAAPAGLRLLRLDAGSQWQRMPAAPADAARAQDAFDELPPAVRRAAQALAPGARSEVDGWHLLREVRGGGDQLLLWQAACAPPDGAAQAAEASAAFSYTVSHDLRAPLRVVDGFARILKEDYGRQLDRIGNDHLDRVLGAAARMNAMIDAMLSVARLSTQPLARQPVDLSQIARYIVDDLRRSQPQRRVEVKVQAGLRAVGDPTLLRQVLENLLSNAWKYTGQREQARIGLCALELEGRRVYEVHDNGAGFDMRHADRLFGLFQRLHGSHEFPGTGVGLASVQRIVRRHGGEIWAESSPGEGARFRFTLPG